MISPVLTLIKRIILLLVIYQLCRLSFFLSNLSYFSTAGGFDIISAFITGIRFDLAVVMMINIPFAFVHILPLTGLWTARSQNILKYFFFITNIPFLLLNCVDLEYFKYQGKRTTADLFQLFGMGEDMQNTLPQMARDFWYVLAVFLVLSVLLVYGYNRIKYHRSVSPNGFSKLSWLLVLPVTGLFVVMARGGIQYKPLGIMSAARLSGPKMVPLVLNTPFTVIRTFGKSLIEEKNYMSDAEALRYFSKDHHFRNSEPFRNENVVIIILESFSSEYIGAFNNGRGYTPFLDSLMNHSLVYTNAFANAKKSIDGIPAVVAAMPTLMPASYVSSPYNSNELKSIAGILKQKGYSSAFFHGGNNGTMNFDNFTLMSGFDAYYGRKEYPGDDYDGHWGVFDEPFYYFFIDKCNEMRQPFVNTFFTLSSHHPYSIPEHLKNRFPNGSLPIHESIGYADYALQKFFERASKTSWFNNTLFVITSDHTGPSDTPKYNTKAGHFMVPVIFYHPSGKLKGFNSRVTQQTDIVPGILDYLNFDEPFTAFGKSMFDTTSAPVAFNYPGDVYQAIGDNLLIQFDGNEVVSAYRYKTDSLLSVNVADQTHPEQLYLTGVIKSVIQQFNDAMIHNKLTPDKNGGR